MVEARLIVADYSSSGSPEVPNPCVIGSAHLYLGSLFVMSEGRRGLNAGRVESRLAVSEVLTRFRSGDTTDPRQRLKDALCHASSVLLSRSRAASVFSNSSATCSAFLIRGDRLYAARVGSMGLQLIRKNRSIVLFDHRAGTTSESSGLGTSDKVHPDVLPDPVPLQAGDRIISGNDLLLNTVTAEECLRIVAELVPAVATRRLVEAVVRSGEKRPVSVQVVEVEDFADERDEVIPPMPLKRSVPDGAPKTASGSEVRLRTPIPDGGERSSRWVPKSMLILLALLVVGMGVRYIKPSWFESERSGSNPPATALDPVISEPSPLSSTEKSLPIDRAEPPAFWHGVSRNSIEGELQLDRDRLRALVVDASELKQRLREAQTLAKDLEALVAEEEALAKGALLHKKSEQGESRSDTAEHSETVENWDPEKLPKNLRGFEQIFGHEDPQEGAARLRRYIAARHKVVGKVFMVLDAYIQRAPKGRSLQVLEKLANVRPAPGPKTPRWAWKTKRMALREEALNRDATPPLEKTQ